MTKRANFKVRDASAPKGFEGGAKQAPRPKANHAETAKHAQDEGETLVEAGQENRQPDYEIDSAEAGSMGMTDGDGQRPVYPASNPWPPAKPVAHKPFKF